MNPNACSKPAETLTPVKWKCWSISGDRYVYYTKKSCRYCVPVYAGDPDVDSPVVR